MYKHLLKSTRDIDHEVLAQFVSGPATPHFDGGGEGIVRRKCGPEVILRDAGS